MDSEHEQSDKANTDRTELALIAMNLDMYGDIIKNDDGMWQIVFDYSREYDFANMKKRSKKMTPEGLRAFAEVFDITVEIIEEFGIVKEPVDQFRILQSYMDNNILMPLKRFPDSKLKMIITDLLKPIGEE